MECPECGFSNPEAMRFCGDCGARLEVVDSAERRRITVLFCDLVGSTAMSGKLDPEELREILQAYYAICETAIRANGGYLAKYLGDGILAYFGYPKASEQHALNAAHAGLDITDEIQKIVIDPGASKEIEIATRVGIHTGVVVAGEVGLGGRRERNAIVGETPNIASRLEGVAPKNGVVVSEVTYKLIKQYVVVDPLEDKNLKGLATPMKVYSVISVNRRQDRLRAKENAGESYSPFTGRGSLLALVERTFEHAAQGGVGTIVLSGEPGIGKSRIAIEFLRGRDTHSHVLTFRGTELVRSTPLLAASDAIAEWMHVGSDSASRSSFSIEQRMTESGVTDPSMIPFLKSLIGFPTGSEIPPAKNAEALRYAIFESVVTLVFELQKRATVIIYIDDIQWIDPSSLELISLLHSLKTRGQIEQGLLLMCTSRPSPLANELFANDAHYVDVTPLARKDSNELLRRLNGERFQDEAFATRVIERAGGNPLFLEELVKTIDENDVLLNDVDVPTTLYDSVMTQIDRLDNAKHVAQIAAVIGREFRIDVLIDVCNQDESKVNIAVANLLNADLVRISSHDGSRVAFKHALVREVAYESLLKSRRVTIHRDVALAIENRASEPTIAFLETLAHHWESGNEFEKALNYFTRASETAVREIAIREASAFNDEAMNQLARVDDEGTTLEYEYRLALVGDTLRTWEKGFTEGKRGETRRVVELAERSGNIEHLMTAYFRSWMATAMRGNPKVDKTKEDKLYAVADASHEAKHRVQAHHASWTTNAVIGRYRDVIVQCDEALSLYQEADSEYHIRLAAHDPQVCALSLSSVGSIAHGQFALALRTVEKAVEYAISLDHGTTLQEAYWAFAIVKAHTGDIAAAIVASGRILELSKSNKSPPLFDGNATAFYGVRYAQDNDYDASLEAIKRSIEQISQIGMNLGRHLAYASLLLSPDIVRSESQRILSLLYEYDQYTDTEGFISETYRLKAMAEFYCGRTDDASKYLSWAYQSASIQDASLLILRAVVSSMEHSIPIAGLSSPTDRVVELLQSIDTTVPTPDIIKANSVIRG